MDSADPAYGRLRISASFSKPGSRCSRRRLTSGWKSFCTAIRWLAGPTAAVPVAAVAVGGITGKEEEKELEVLNDWMEEHGLPAGMLDYDFADASTGEQKSVFDLAWPNGIQEELSQPVAVLLNESKETIAIASQAGYRCFTAIAEFRRYVQAEILVEVAGISQRY